MKRLDLWVGEWKGSGWVSAGAGQRHEISMDEKVQRRVGGTVLLVEGRGTRKTDDGGVVVTHEALALLYYDDRAGRYHWNAYDLRGASIDVEPKLVDGGFEWASGPRSAACPSASRSGLMRRGGTKSARRAQTARPGISFWR
jgi:hypothetical protein